MTGCWPVRLTDTAFRLERVMTMKIRIATVGIVTVILFCGIADVSASRVAHMTADQMATNSVLVVTGRVSSVESYWNEKNTKIFTKTTITVDETFKGDHRSRIELIQLGGIVGNIRVNVEGSLSWAQDEEVLLFLEPYENDTYQVSGLSQGKFLIERDPETGERFVSRAALEGVELLQADGSVAAEDSRLDKVSLDRFIADVLSAE